MNSPFVLFITGISTSGKTTVYDAIREDPEYKGIIHFHDIDEDGIPEYGRGYWRPYRVEVLLGKALENYKREESTVIVGVTLPEEVFNSKQFSPELNIHFLLLEIERSEMELRLKARLEKQNKSSKEAAYDSLAVYNAQLSEKLYNYVSSIKSGHIIQTKNMPIGQMVEQVRSIISALSVK